MKTPIDWRALRAEPSFRLAAERNAAELVALRDTLSPRARWLSNDMGRMAVLTRILLQDAREGRATANDILATNRERGTSSQGRVLQVIRRAEAAGWLLVEPGEGDWRQRRLRVQPSFFELYRGRAVVEIGTASLVIPEIAPAVALVADDPFFLAFLGRLARFDGEAPELRERAMPSIRHFLQHDAGLSMLYDLIGRQDAGRERLLESAPLSRRALASRFKVSRSHVERVFTKAEQAGYLSLPSRNRVHFSEAMSEEAEQHFALTFHVVAASALGAMDAVRDAGETAAAKKGRSRPGP